MEHGYDVMRRIEEDPTGLLNEGWRPRDLETGCFIVADMLGRVPVNSPGNDAPGSPGTYNIMMPKEKWFVDGKSVSEREYNEALEPGVPQAGNGPTKTAKDSGQEADYHVAGSEEGAIPGQKSHYHTAAAGSPNLYTYVSQNPWTFFDPEGLVEDSPSNKKKREQINKIAKGYDGSARWAFTADAGGGWKPGTNKCSKFVYDVTREGKAKLPIKDGGEPRAGDIANPKENMKNWRTLGPKEAPKPGDVAAYPLNDGHGGSLWTGHTSVMISDGKGGTTNISAHGDTVHTDPKQFTNEPGLQFRRYTGE